MSLRIVTRTLQHPDAVTLTGELQREYLYRYGHTGHTPVEAGEFAPPRGLFLVGYRYGTPLACGGWRRRDAARDGLFAGDAEMKRLYVTTAARRYGYARAILAALESTARAAGVSRMVLETGTEQPEAIDLYNSSGYVPMTAFGVHRCALESVYLAKLLQEGSAASA